MNRTTRYNLGRWEYYSVILSPTLLYVIHECFSNSRSYINRSLWYVSIFLFFMFSSLHNNSSFWRFASAFVFASVGTYIHNDIFFGHGNRLMGWCNTMILQQVNLEIIVFLPVNETSGGLLFLMISFSVPSAHILLCICSFPLPYLLLQHGGASIEP